VCLSTLLPLRSIPTCVGLGQRERCTGRPHSVHPHVRGARHGLDPEDTDMYGPSPRAWGSVRRTRNRCRHIQSIPTCVGLGSRRASRPSPRAVHPHLRGAWRPMTWLLSGSIGPSPRAWGLADQVVVRLGSFRSIPTCVGLGSAATRPGAPAQVHPHVRGAWLLGSDDAVAVGGPSPRAWGLGGSRDRSSEHERSIPTCVGLGPCIGIGRLWTWVHPHVRGAWCQGAIMTEVADGPSPRAWGLERHPRTSSARDRSIPTCVGLGSEVSRRCQAAAVHPHVRGAWPWLARPSRLVFGPSPRAWGLAFLTTGCRHPERSIPTCVGLGRPGPRPAGRSSVHPHVRGAWPGCSW